MPKKEVLKLREDGFNINNLRAVRLNEYNALHDPNMRHFFENKKVQRLLYETGQIDKHGRVIELHKVQPRLNILEREFKEAEAVESRLQKEELEMRYRIQRKRFNELDRIRNQEVMEKLRLERELSKEIISTMKSATNPATSTHSIGSRNRVGGSKKLIGNGSSITFGNSQFSDT